MPITRARRDGRYVGARDRAKRGSRDVFPEVGRMDVPTGIQDTNHLSTRGGAHVEGGLVRMDIAPVSGHQCGNVIRQFVADDVDARSVKVNTTVKSGANRNNAGTFASSGRS